MSGNGFSVVKVRDTLLVTIPPDPDDDDVQALEEQSLCIIEKTGARALVLDVSLVDTLDSFFARVLAEIAQMVSLMGGRTVIVGMRPSVAITATQLGLTLGNVKTALTVDCALDILGADSFGRSL